MKILVLGSGGREHALVWKLKKSPRVTKCYCIPGNAGICGIADCKDIDLKDFARIADFVKKEKIDLTIVGPELPLVGGISDYFKKEGLNVFGPMKSAALLEGSKVFAKKAMKKYGVPTAFFEVFTDSARAIEYIMKKGAPIVLKADGLAAGKGVIVAKSTQEAIAAVKNILDDKIFGDAGNTVIVEDCLEGEEVSVLAFVSGDVIMPLISSQDHKRIYDNDKGPNTGGMGAYSPAPLFTKDLEERVKKEVFVRLIEGLKSEGIVYNGILYAGLMIKNNSFNVLEFNVRFGDPETQAILPMMETDLLDAIEACVDNRLDKLSIKWHNGSCVCVVLASKGYPDKYEKDKEITVSDLLKDNQDISVFHAGTRLDNNKVVTSGGRVLGVTSLGNGIEDAREKAYSAIKNINFEGMQYRTDIGLKALKYK